MRPLPDNILYIARRTRQVIGISADGRQTFGMCWAIEVHVKGSALSCGMPCVGEFLHSPPSIDQVWEAIQTAVSEKVEIGNPIPSFL